ncbi:MAG TPA: glycosyltransferase [Gemmataceae bacterium]|nr:glycosyltransferase [Gemmataceae bacterium]
MTAPPRLAVLTDYPDEGWPSMDLCGEMLLAHLPRTGSDAVAPQRICPPFRRVAGRVPVVGRRGAAFNTDRLLNRFVLFPRHARRVASHFDLFHVVDHTYAQLVHALPAERTGVYCHDLDAFRCLLEPAADPRPRWFRALARRILAGMQKAAVVFHSTAAVRGQIERAGLLDPAKLVHASYGLAPEFTAPESGVRGQESGVRAGSGNLLTPDSWPLTPELAGRPWVAHVGSCIPRKRIDILLEVVAAVRVRLPDLRLVKVGGEWSADHRDRIARHGLADAIVHVQNLSRAELAAVYQRAGAVLVPSEAEGFGLPVVEALSCGAAVVASDIAPLREAGGPAAVYAPVGDVAAWTEVVAKALTDPTAAPPRADRLAWAARFSWATHAGTIAAAYHRLVKG